MLKGSRWMKTRPVDEHPESGGEAYCFAKVKQEEIVSEYGKERGIPYVIVRPGYVYGPGKGASAAGWASGPSASSCISAARTRFRSPTSTTARRPSSWPAGDRGRRRGVQRRRRRPALEPAVLCACTSGMWSGSTSLYVPARREPCALLPVGEVLELVGGAAAARLQPEPMARLLEEDALHQREAEGAARLAPRVRPMRASAGTSRAAGSGARMLKVAIVGCGKIADSHAAQIQTDRGLRDRRGLRPRAADGAAAVRALPGQGSISRMSADSSGEARPGGRAHHHPAGEPFRDRPTVPGARVPRLRREAVHAGREGGPEDSSRWRRRRGAS